MYVVASVSSNKIEGTQGEKPVGEFFNTNGKFFVPTPAGVAIDVTSASTLTPQVASSIPYDIANGFLDRNPNFSNAIWNFFLETSDIALLDLSPTAPTPSAGNVVSGYAPVMVGGSLGPRNQVGRSTGPAPTGIVPNSIAILPANTKTSGTSQYGSLVSANVDLTPYNPSNPGTDEVLVWWKIARASTTEDVSNGYGATSGKNSPSIKSFVETQPNFPGFRVYASVDDGGTWFECTYLRPKDLVTSGTDFRLAFVNESSEKLFLLGFVVLFPNL